MNLAALRDGYADVLRLRLAVLARRTAMIDGPSRSPLTIRAGARVKLKTHRLSPARNAALWRDRVGTIVRIQDNGQDVAVRWDNRRTLDFWPRRALNVVIEDAPALAPA